jgi:hypothetical protein
MNARGLKEVVGTASHAPIVQLRATPGDLTHVSLRKETQRSAPLSVDAVVDASTFRGVSE